MNSDIAQNAEEQQQSSTEQFLVEKANCAKAKLKDLLINISTSVRDRKNAGRFYVCDVNVVRDLIKPFDIAWGAGESPYNNISYNVLRSIHCANYSNFTDKMNRLLPEIVIEALAFNHESLKEYLGESDYEEVVKAINAPFSEETKEGRAEKSPYHFFKSFFVVVSTALVVSAIVSSIFLWALYSADIKPLQSDIRFIGVPDVGGEPIMPRSDEPVLLRISPERELAELLERTEQLKAEIEATRILEGDEGMRKESLKPSQQPASDPDREMADLIERTQELKAKEMYRKEIKNIIKPQDSAHDENHKK
ncbi:hypothetical protein ACTG16_22935 [Aeromonas sp. 23P]|uniref:hypothetical protein n=1 Tax=Aeromonas sp. 23P TaxID=3452716 RepID=UPI003F7AF142